MFLIALLPDLPGCSIEQVSSTQETIVINLSSTREGATFPNCGKFSSRVHSTYTRSPKTLPSGARPVRLLLQVRRFRCSQPNCQRKTFAEPFPAIVAPHAQRTFSMRYLLRIIGEAMGTRLEHL
ncbi:transposase family protein [Tengunoibacter tsumagoiensis]|uniref:transposase family protein n=1 Tax=Tengunoibacter tsumagoiensis TaxID=2014871 RepID=UPI000F81C96B